jgi:polyhydroxybutyrate depolymerase
MGVFRAAIVLGVGVSLTAGCAASGASPAWPSAGCGKAPPRGTPASIAVDGRQRDLMTAVPAAYDRRKPHDLVIAFHGLTNSNADVRRYYDLERHAHRPTVFVYPSGLPAGDGRRSWSDPGDPASALRDYALFGAIIARIGGAYCIDRSRVFAVGHSLGAWFVNSLGCARGADLRATGAVAGGISRSDCTGQVAAVVVHNPNDRLVAFAHGEEVRDFLLRRNSHAGPGRPEPGAEHLNCVRYGDEDDRNPVLWCPHTRDRTRGDRFYPHQWPAETGSLIMRFFDGLPAMAAQPR